MPLPGWVADAVSVVPAGAAPSSHTHGYYERDNPAHKARVITDLGVLEPAPRPHRHRTVCDAVAHRDL